MKDVQELPIFTPKYVSRIYVNRVKKRPTTHFSLKQPTVPLFFINEAYYFILQMSISMPIKKIKTTMALYFVICYSNWPWFFISIFLDIFVPSAFQ